MLFLLMFVALFVSAYVYIGIRYILPVRLSRSWKVLLWLVIAGCILLPFMQIIFMFRDHSSILTRMISLSAYGTLGFLSLLLFPTILRDILYIASLLIRRYALVRSPASRAARNRFIRLSNLALLIIASLLMCYGVYEAVRIPDVHEVYLPVDGLPAQFEGFRIVQITDIHIGSVLKGRFLDEVVARVNSLEADVIVITGDLVDGSVDMLRDDVAPISQLRAPHGVFFTTGNHEYYSGAEEWIAELRRLGIDVLMNEHRTVDIDGAVLILAGVTDYSAGNHLPAHRSDPAGAIEGALASSPSILFAHQPRSIFAASAAGYDVMISGHTHGGQYYPWNLFVPLQQPYSAGLHRYNDTWIYVSTGTGFWGPPLRIGIPSEITEFILTTGSAPDEK